MKFCALILNRKCKYLYLCNVLMLSIWLIYLSKRHIFNRKQVFINESVILESLKYKNLSFNNINFNLGRWDNQRLYKYFDFASTGKSFDNTSNSTVCMATQSSIDNLHFLVQVANNWNGSISIALYIVGNDEFKIAQLYVTYLRQCYDAIANNVNFHLAIPKNEIPKNYTINLLDILQFQNTCSSSHESILKKLLLTRSAEIVQYQRKNGYPQNHLRNLGRKGCQSEHVFVTDIDIIPNAGLANQLERFLTKTPCLKLCAFVIPTYEIQLSVNFPKTKKELLHLIKTGFARPFHKEVFKFSHYATNFFLWEHHNSPNQEIRISHKVKYYKYLYEPFYVASDNVPIHDERFIGYGYTRNSQVFEMFAAGYVFKVLSPAFTCHWGFKSEGQPAWRNNQVKLNEKKFNFFKKEINEKQNIHLNKKNSKNFVISSFERLLSNL